MRIAAFLAGCALFATGAEAQVLGGQVGGAVSRTVGGVGQAGSAVGGAGRVDPALPDVSRNADVARRAADDTALRTPAPVDKAARDRPTVRVKAGASVRVAQGTRCYYAAEDYYSDPAYRDGYYYCERTGPAVGVRGGAEAGGG